MASWTSRAAIGARSMPTNARIVARPLPLRSREPPKRLFHQNIRAMNEIAPAKVAATDITRMSRLLTWDISWARTPRSSSSERRRRIPSVTATTACCGFLPVANALGVCVGTMATLGIGRFAICATWRTMRYRPGASASVTSFARYDQRTIRSDAKYETAFMTPASTRNSKMPAVGPNHKLPIAQPKNTKMPVNRAKRANVRTYAPMTPLPFSCLSLRTRRSHMKLMRECPQRQRSEAKDLRVPFHVHETVAAHVERDDLPLPSFLAFHRLVDRAGDAVGALRGGQESLGLDELPGAFEDVLFILRVRDRVDEAAVPKQGEDRGATVVSQAVALDGTHLRLVAERVHLQERREFRMVREIVPIFSLEIRCGGALGYDEPDGLPFDRVREKGEGETAEVRAASET